MRVYVIWLQPDHIKKKTVEMQIQNSVLARQIALGIQQPLDNNHLNHLNYLNL